MILKPEILCHPHIPKPLHGMNPRTIEGSKWWNNVRQEAYARYNYRCIACGVHKSMAQLKKHLEAHEFWEIDYQTGICIVTSIEPLCHYCHNFIHAGRLQVLGERGDYALYTIKSILEHGFKILSIHNLKCYPDTLDFAYMIKAKTFNVKSYVIKRNPNLKWLDYKLIWQGKEYHSLYKSETEYLENYGR